MEFFRSHEAVPQPGPTLQSGQQLRQTTGYKLQFGDWSIALFTYANPERPAAVAMLHGNEHSIYYYSGYGLMPFDATLFAKPSGVKIEEAKQ